MKLGKLPARPDAVKLKLSTFLKTSTLPVPPKVFGHQSLVSSYGMLGNDKFGDCVWAGAGHETMLWCKESGTTTSFTDKSVLSDYSAVTGFDPKKPDTDQGTDMQVAASYRRKTGVIDSKGKRHQIGAYLAIKAGNFNELKQAVYLFGAVGVGIEFPSSAMDQFNAGKPWDVVKGSKIEGGHYIPGVGFDGKNLLIVTWGKVQAMTQAFFEKYNDESIAYVSAEALKNGKSLEGFDLAALQADLSQLS